MSSAFNGGVSFVVFGESHGSGIGIVLDGLPPGEKIDLEKTGVFMARRAPRKDGTSTRREESDVPEILSGLYNGKTSGTPLCAIIRNAGQRSADYEKITRGNVLPRPGHADYTGHIRYGGHNDARGGGHFSGRLTAPLCFAGSVCGQILERRGVTTGAHIYSVGNAEDEPFDPVCVSENELNAVKARYLPLLNAEKDDEMRRIIGRAQKNGDSVGGIIECCAVGVPAGVGSPMLDGLENVIARLIFAIPAVKGIEFGAGFAAAKMKGSRNNDEFYVKDGEVLTKTNNHGGILGGISSGMPIIFRAAVKPTPSVALPQKTVDLSDGTEAVIKIAGRHDPCIVPRAVPAVEAALNVALLSLM
ncbi:MAG: chorismate synthase [Oscillospiraceae bacterium]|jgi:chorismate synthase|nr:chorismate synthase [Oscillospiraceae bacterium]